MNTTGHRNSQRRVPQGKGTATLAPLITVVALLLATGAAARPAEDAIRRVVPPSQDAHDVSRPTARTETLWIFDADFEDLLGDNAGWTSYDRSGSTGYINYWHKDTIRMSGFPHLGDSTWWCGTYDDCWRQPRGYGNDWVCILSRNFPEVTVGSEPGDALQLEYDQRIAIEARYDYGYTDVSTDGGATWTTVTSVTNPGFPGTPGPGMSWNNTHPSCPGHEIIDLSEFAGEDLALRFRFESTRRPARASTERGSSTTSPGTSMTSSSGWTIARALATMAGLARTSRHQVRRGSRSSAVFTARTSGPVTRSRATNARVGCTPLSIPRRAPWSITSTRG
jgi:hypothetical protein